MLEQGHIAEERSKASLRSAFPLFLHRDFEICVNRSSYEVGVDKSYPAELRERISAAIVSYCMQLKSVDYTRKTYFQDVDYFHEEEEDDSFRLDLRISRICIGELDALFDVMAFARDAHKGEPLTGIVVGDATLARLRFSLNRAFSEANRGALYEATAIARMIVEQLSWVSAISALDDSDLIRATPVTASVRSLKAHVPFAGRLYGWMSDHAHWGFEAHTKAIDFSGKFPQTLLATSKFKAVAFAALVATTATVAMALKSIRHDFIDDEKLILRRKEKLLEDNFLPRKLIEDIINLIEDDADISVIADMLAEYRLDHG